MNLNSTFSISEFREWLRINVPDYTNNIQPIDIKDPDILKAETLGVSDNLNIRIFVIKTTSDVTKKKVGLAKSSFAFLKRYAVSNAIIAYYSDNSDTWRLSLLTSSPVWSDNKVIIKVSNPRRFSYLLGKSAKTNTPQKYLISKGPMKDLEDLKSRFSLEVVNKEFYKAISQSFTKLISNQLKLPSISEKNKVSLEFAVRLIGRTIFCWFLREKVSDKGISLMPKDLLSRSALDSHKDYYHSVLEPIFFEVLNRSMASRIDDFKLAPFNLIPYLNGGLFSPQDDDYYGRGKSDLQSKYHNTLVIPDDWFKELFDTLETYNFTIDENTSFDEELSIDPEMLGRIFENLLAEINPETGESARKSTGSYYTPRTIVNYMVDECLFLYLQEKTKISEEKLRVLISYDLSDDIEHPLNAIEQELVVVALEEVKILDPSCGSGAFPMGALQKIVFILEQIDPNGQIWFKKQIHKVSPEIKRVIEKEFANKNFDYIRKLNIIRENIYGIDIQPIATEISRLRCFLTLVVDQQIHEDQENRGIAPLPNLDFKFVTANSLIGLPQQVGIIQEGLFEDHANIDRLSEVRTSYFSASNAERSELKNKFYEIQNDMLTTLVAEHRPAELTEKLATWKPFTHALTSWFDSSWMFGIKDGFNIVIGNPPYVSAPTMVSTYKEQRQGIIDSKKYKTLYQKWDLYIPFMELGLQLLAINGVYSMIVPYPLTNQNYGKKLRELITNQYSIKEIVDLNGIKVFENATVSNCIPFIINSDPQNTCYISKINQYGKVEKVFIQSIDNLIQNKSTLIWNLTSEKRESTRHSNFNVLGDYCYITKGMVLNADENNAKGEFSKEDLISDTYDEVHCRKYIEAKDIEKYRVKKERYLEYNTERCPDKLSRPTFRELYERPKLMFNRLGNLMVVLDDKVGYLHSDSMYSAVLWKDLTGVDNKSISASVKRYSNFAREKMIKLSNGIELRYLLGVLNSKYASVLLTNLRAGDYHIYPEHVRNIPIPNISDNYQRPIVNLVDKILVITRQTEYDFKNPPSEQKMLEKQIDQMVYKLYSLSAEEIKSIEAKAE